MNNKNNVGIIILAAGGSTRLGTPKQLVEFEEKTLIRRIAQTALATTFKTTVVIGAFADLVAESIKDLPVETVINNEWKRGMSFSIKAGLQNMLKLEPHLSAVILLLCDQPFITKDTILGLFEAKKETGKAIVASEYKKTIGTPALFAREMFEELLCLEGDQGAKPLIEKYRGSNLAVISSPEAAFDVDTPDDVRFLQTRSK